jgi:pimeloyl-ACP methyl ester carboxylesterase
LYSFLAVVFSVAFFLNRNEAHAQAVLPMPTEEVTFTSEGARLSGTLYTPQVSYTAVVLVHGSGQESRMREFATLLAASGISVLTYDKRGVGASEGVYTGPEVGTNNIDSTNLHLLAQDARAAVKLLKQKLPSLPLGLLGFSQAGWIIPLAATANPLVEFMVLFSGPTVTTLEQLRFQFYTAGRTDFWEHHSETDAREHIQNDPDRFQFAPTDPKESLAALTIPGLWLFGGKDIQIPTNLCIEQLQALKAQGKPFDYVVFPELGHRTGFAGSALVAFAIEWIKTKSQDVKSLQN